RRRVTSIRLALLPVLGLDQDDLVAAVVLQHSDQPIIKTTNLQHGHEGLAIAQPLTGQLLEEGVDLLRLCRHLPSQQDIAVFIPQRDRDLPCVLIDSEVQHVWFSCSGGWVKGRYFTLPT